MNFVFLLLLSGRALIIFRCGWSMMGVGVVEAKEVSIRDGIVMSRC